MSERYQVKVIARMHSLFPTKFGIPRQSGLVDAAARRWWCLSRNTANPEALRGAGGIFPPVADLAVFPGGARGSGPPRCARPSLGGNRRMGVFATRSPFRPNAIGPVLVSCWTGMEQHPQPGARCCGCRART